ncbi:hypothetical protein JCM3263A_09720 [Thermobifida fusca]
MRGTCPNWYASGSRTLFPVQRCATPQPPTLRLRGDKISLLVTGSPTHDTSDGALWYAQRAGWCLSGTHPTGPVSPKMPQAVTRKVAKVRVDTSDKQRR